MTYCYSHAEMEEMQRRRVAQEWKWREQQAEMAKRTDLRHSEEKLEMKDVTPKNKEID